MKITVGTTELQVTNCYAYRYPNGRLVLKIELPQTEIGHDELKALLKGNDGDIVKTGDDGITESFSGFSYTVAITDKDDMYYAELECVSETERKVGDLQNAVESQRETLAEQSAIIALQTETITAQESEIALLNETLLEVLMA